MVKVKEEEMKIEKIKNLEPGTVCKTIHRKENLILFIIEDTNNLICKDDGFVPCLDLNKNEVIRMMPNCQCFIYKNAILTLGN